MKRPLAFLLLLLGGGGGASSAQGFLIPPPSSPSSRAAVLSSSGGGCGGSSLCKPFAPPSYDGPRGAGAGAGAVTGAGHVACRPRGALWASSSVEEQQQQEGGRRRARQRGAEARRQARQPQQQQPPPPQPQMSNLPVGPDLVQPKKPVLTGLVSWLASRLIRRKAMKVSGLDIDVGARSNGDVLAGNLPRVQAKFDRIVLESLQISGGGQMEITGLNVRVLGLLLARRLNVIRRPFEIFGQYVLTQQDVSASKLIRDLIQLLVNNVLRTLFPSLHLTFFDVAIDQVRIRDQKLAIMGTASIAEAEDGMPFTLLTGVGLAGDGHIVYLDNPELVLNPDAPLPVKVPLGSIRAFDVDIGENARIERIEIDDRLGVSITARTLITPAPPFHVTDMGKRAAFLYDLGAFFSSFFGFTHWEELGLGELK